jgi:AraC family transcriptional regulator
MNGSDPKAMASRGNSLATRLVRGAAAYRRALGAAGGCEVESLVRGSGRPAFCVALYESQPYDLLVPAMPVSRLAITLTASRVSGNVEGERSRRFDTSRHALFLTPAGAAARWRKDSPSRHLGIYFDAEAMAPDTGDAPKLRPSAPMLNAVLPGLRNIAEELATELGRSDLFVTEAIDSLVRLLLVRVARAQSQRAEKQPALSPQLMVRLREFARAKLADRILVADLAAVVGLSPHSFAHAFNACAGQPPHRFVIDLRLERAIELLQHSRRGLAEIAVECGFASQQHMTNTMRRSLGVTPGRYRASTMSPAPRQAAMVDAFGRC